MVTVALEMHIIMQGGAHLQAADACHPLSLSTGAGHPASHVLVHLHSFPTSAFCPMPVFLPHWSWGGVGWGSALQGQVKVGTLDAPIHFQWSLSQMMGLGAQHVSGNSVLGMMGHWWDGSLGLGGVHPTSLMVRQTPGRKSRRIPKLQSPS